MPLITSFDIAPVPLIVSTPSLSVHLTLLPSAPHSPEITFAPEGAVVTGTATVVTGTMVVVTAVVVVVVVSCTGGVVMRGGLPSNATNVRLYLFA